MFQIASFKIICTDSTKILFSQILLNLFFSKLGSVGLNYHLPKLNFFTDPYYGGGVSYKHCMLKTLDSQQKLQFYNNFIIVLSLVYVM